MASLKERYEELFGPTPDYDPIDIDAPDVEGAERRALDLQATAPSASPRQRAIPTLPSVPEEPQGALSGLLKRGVGALAQGALGIPEYVSRKMPDVPGMQAVTGTLEQGRINIEQWRQDIADRMDPEVMDMVGRELMTLDPDRTIWRGSPLEVAEAVLYKVTEQVPMMAATLIPGAVLMRTAAAGRGVTYLGASEAGLSLGFIQNDIADEISAMSTEDLMRESPRFAQLMGEMDETQARTQLIQEAQGMAPVIGGLAVGAISAAAGRYLEPVITGKAGLGFGQRVGRGAISEGLLQEGPQESIETIASNVAAAVYDGDRETLEGVVESYAQGALLGGIMGGGVAGLVGTSRDPADTPDPSDLDTPDAPSAFLGGPTGDQMGLDLTGGESVAPRRQLGEQTTMDFGVDDSLFDEDGNYVGSPLIQEQLRQERAQQLEESGQVPEDVQAAITANIREDNMMRDMFTSTPGFQEPVQGEMFPTGAPTTGVPMAQPGTPVPAADPNMPEQQEMLPGPERRTMGNAPMGSYVMPDQPQAEPEFDINGQLQELRRGGREGVYLAPDQQVNPTMLEGLPVEENFDGKGGTMVFRNEQTRREALQAREQLRQSPDMSGTLTLDRPQGQIDEAGMQELIGALTGAGTGKPVDGRLAVQRLDANGAVVQETLVSTPAEAEQIMRDWGPNSRTITAEEAMARREAGLRQPDLFEAAPAPTPAPRGETTTERPPAESRGRFRVRFTDDAGATLEDRTFSNLKKAEEYADSIADDYGLSAADADARVQLTPVRELPKQKTRPTQEEQAQQAKKEEPRRFRKTAGEEAVEEERKAPMEDRPAPSELKEIAEAETKEDVAKAYVRQAARRMDKEQAQVIGGMFPPSAYDFKNPADEGRYTEVWEQLVETEQQIADEGVPKQAPFHPLKVKRQKLLKKLGQLRQLYKPTRSAQSKIQKAAAADKSTVRTLRRNASKVAQKIDTTTGDTLTDLPMMSRAEVYDLQGSDLDIAYERALLEREGKKKNFDIEKHRARRSPAHKRKMILRTLNARRNREQSAASKKLPGQRFATTSPQGVQTEALTGVTYKADESKADQLKREQRARAVMKELAGMAKQALKRLRAIEVERDANGELTDKGHDQLLAKQYVEQTVQLAQAIIETGQTDLGTIKLAESISNMLGKINTAGDLKLANLMRKQETLIDQFIDDRGIRQRGKESKKDRAAAVAKQNKQHAASLKARERMDTLWPAEFTYRTMVRPILVKMSESYYTVKGYYRPSQIEMEELAWVADQWKNDPNKDNEKYYTPLRRALTNLGFEWNQDGTLKKEWEPTDSMLTNRAPKDSPMEVKYEATARTQTAEQFNKERAQQRKTAEATGRRADSEAMRQEAARHVRATTILAAFRKVVDNSKSTINRLVDAEKKMIADLNAEGFLPQNATTFVVIRVPGRSDITYRRVSADLGNRRITKAQARRRMQSVTKKATQEMAYYRDLAPASARDLTGTQTADTSFEYVLELGLDQWNQYNEEYNNAGSAVVDLINYRGESRQSNAVLAQLAANLPQNSMYAQVVRKLQQLDLSDVTVQFDWSGKKVGDGARATWNPRDRAVYIKRGGFGQKYGGAEMVHTVLHELVHAATQESIRQNGNLRNLLEEVRDEARRQFKEQFGDTQTMPYGLQEGTPVDEFVAEMFSNPTFQQFAKTVQLDSKMSFWEEFKMLVKRILNWVQGQETNAFDLVMELESTLFEYADRKSTEGPELNLGDSVLLKPAQELYNRIRTTAGVEKRARGLKSGFGRGAVSHSIMTMRQLLERYSKYFGGEQGPLARYMKSFFARNAKNNELLQLPEKLSRKWTELRESNPEMELEFSRLATDSTIHALDPSQSSTHQRNKDSAKAQPELYKELRSRFKQLSPEYKQLWRDVTSYYQASLESETKLLLLNAIRGVVTKGSGVTMDVDQFARKYNENTISKYDTVEKLKDEFGEYLGETEEDVDNMVGLINRLANVPQMKQGVYFPLMRYGDYVVYAYTDRSPEYFADSTQANGRAAELRTEDPTLTVNVKKESDGRYSVRVRESAFITGENAYEVEQKREELIGAYDNVGDVDLKSPRFDDKASIESNAALSSIIGALEGNAAAQNAIKQFYLRSLGDASFRKREIKRQNRRGADADLQHRNFANYAKQSAYYRSQLEYGWQMSKGLSDMDEFIRNRKQSEQPPELQGMSTEQLRQVYNTLDQRDALMTDPVKVHKLVRGGIAMTQFYMLTSASYHMINSSQPWMVTLPTMGGRFGWGQAFAAMKEAQGMVKDPIFDQVKESKGGFSLLPWLKKADVKAENAFGVFDQLTERFKEKGWDEELAMLEELRKTQVLEVSPLTELREMASGKTGKMAKALDASRVMAHLVEVNNRTLTAVAAYRLEKNRLLAEGVGPEKAKEMATRYAEDMVSQTQFDYSTANKPPLFMKAPLLFQFMQWSQHIYAHLIRNWAGAVRGDKEARAALLGVLGTHAMVGGMIGVALQPIKMAIGLALMMFGDEDEPYTFKNAMSGASFDRTFERWTSELFGTTASTVLSRGLPAALGADVSTRMSLGTLYFIDLRGDTPESVLGSMASSFGGAFVNQTLQFGRGLQYIGSGDIAKGLEMFSPKFLRDILRAGRLATDGLVNNAGDQVLDTGDLGFVDVALQAIGFTPTTMSQFYQGQAAIKDAEAYVRQRKSRLLREFRTADYADRAAIVRQVIEFNRAYPQEAITRSSLLRNVRSRAEREAQYRRYGAAIDDRKAALYRGYGEPYR